MILPFSLTLFTDYILLFLSGLANPPPPPSLPQFYHPPTTPRHQHSHKTSLLAQFGPITQYSPRGSRSHRQRLCVVRFPLLVSSRPCPPLLFILSAIPPACLLLLIQHLSPVTVLPLRPYVTTFTWTVALFVPRFSSQGSFFPRIFSRFVTPNGDLSG